MHNRTGMRTSWLFVATVLLTALMVFFASGCGGGGDSGNNGGGGNPTPTPVPTATPLRTAGFKVRIEWGERSSRLVGLSSALSARITLEGGSRTGGDITWVRNRPDTLAAVTETYDSPELAVVGNHILTVRFYSSANATGDPIGFAQASASVTADGSLIVTISTYTGISTVRLIENQSVSVGETKPLAFEARNFQNNIVAVSSGSGFFTVSSGTANLEVVSNGSEVRGLRPIEAFVTVRVDSATSAPVRVAVLSATTVDTNPATATIGSEFPLPIVATVANAPETDVTFSIEGAAGVDNGSLEDVTGTTATYVAPKITGTNVRNVTIVVTSKYDSIKIKRIPVTINAPATVTVTPATPDISLEEVINFSAVVNNLSPRIATDSPSRGVRWEVLKDTTNPTAAVGTITTAGVYTAPKREGTFTVRATSVYDTTKFVDVPVKVESKVAVTIAPATSPVLEWDDTLNLTATVSRTTNQQVTWTATGPGGAVNSAITTTGVNMARFTAPKVDGTYTITATSVYDNRRSASVQIVVLTAVRAIVTPNLSPAPVKVSINGTKGFSASLTGLPIGRDGTVTYTIVGPNNEPNTGNIYGTVASTSSTTARYTAPASRPAPAGRLKVIAKSNYDDRVPTEVVVEVVSGSIGVGVN